MNDLFDELDSKYIGHKNPLKWPLKRGDVDKIARIKDHIAYFERLISMHTRKLQCFEGVILTLKSMLNLCEDIFENNSDIDFVILGKLNQDALENFFYKLRASQGVNCHPTANEVQYIVARLMSMQILRHRFKDKGSNCEDDDDVFLDWVENKHPLKVTGQILMDNDIDEDPDDKRATEDEDQVVDYPDTEIAVCENTGKRIAEEDPFEGIPDEIILEETPKRRGRLDSYIDVYPEDKRATEDEDQVADYPYKETAVCSSTGEKVVEENPFEDIPDEIFLEEIPERPGELQVQRYYTGYSMHNQFRNKINCEKCIELMSKKTIDLANTSEALIVAKNYKAQDDLRLMNPDDDFFEISRLHMKWYMEMFSISNHKPGIKKTIIDYIRSKSDRYFTFWFNKADECAEHRLQLLNFMVTTLLYKNAKWSARRVEAQLKRTKYLAKKKKAQ
ncbi:uncharacterized protein [Eurosta solidaginis]|uniref:uncharacterized protein n=1 Tax=Eurosta solidaginis TaxID=178769 RepID=UPI0035308439